MKRQKKIIYFIQGLFFQDIEQFSIVHQPEIEGGARVAVSTKMYQCMFSGIIYPDPDDEANIIGEMIDHFGESILRSIKITSQEVSFKKQYNRENYAIDYNFRKEGDVWVGGYSAEETGDGQARCLITEVPERLFV